MGLFLFELYVRFKHLFTKEIVFNLLQSIIIYLSLSILLYLLIISLFKITFYSNKSLFIICILTSIFILLVGLFAIELIVGVPNLNSVLRDSNDVSKIVGSIDCEDDSNEFLDEGVVNCKIKKPILLAKESTILLFSKGTLLDNISDSLTFNASPEIDRIEFYIKGIDIDNVVINLEVGRNFKFVSPEQVVKNKDKRLAYVFGLLGIVLFSIPVAFLTLRDLYMGKN